MRNSTGASVPDQAGRASHGAASSTASPPSGDHPSREALEEAVYVIRNAAGVSEWHRRHSSRPFDFEDFCVWADHWILAHPVVTEIAALQDRDVLLRADQGDA